MRAILEFIRHNRYAGLLASLILLALIGPEAQTFSGARIASAVILSLILLSSAVAVSSTKRDRNIALTSAILAASLWFIYNIGGEHTFALNIAIPLVNFIFVAVMAGILLKDVFNGDVTANKLCGALCGYLLIGTAFALLYVTALIADPHCFRFVLSNGAGVTDASTIGRAERFSILLYHSFLTLSTCGYGDIAPLSGPVRSLCWIEAIFGQSYLAILVARLVGLHIVATADSSQKPA